MSENKRIVKWEDMIGKTIKDVIPQDDDEAILTIKFTDQSVARLLPQDPYIFIFLTTE